MNGKWKLLEQANRIQLIGWYVNLDDDLVKFPELVNDTNMIINTTLENEYGIVQFCGVGHHPEENCYQKIK